MVEKGGVITKEPFKELKGSEIVKKVIKTCSTVRSKSYIILRRGKT